METVAKFSGISEYVLEKLVGMGYFQTRTEALRAGILGLGKEYKLLDDPRELEDALAVGKITREKERYKNAALTPLNEMRKKYPAKGR